MSRPRAPARGAWTHCEKGDRNRAHRDRVNAKVMKDKRLAKMMDPKRMPFDVKRMTYGGFTTIVSIS